MDMIGKVRRLRPRKKLTISEIAKVTGTSRPTVRKWLLPYRSLKVRSRLGIQSCQILLMSMRIQFTA